MPASPGTVVCRARVRVAGLPLCRSKRRRLGGLDIGLVLPYNEIMLICVAGAAGNEVAGRLPAAHVGRRDAEPRHSSTSAHARNAPRKGAT